MTDRSVPAPAGIISKSSTGLNLPRLTLYPIASLSRIRLVRL
jgi:hypothetical protein